MGTLFTSHLTPSEVERFAYIMDDKLLASYAELTDELEGQTEGFDDLLEAAKEQAFEDGKREGMGLDTAKLLDEANAATDEIATTYQRCLANLQAVSDWLANSANHNTLAKRKDFATKVRQALNAIPRY